MDHYSIFWTFDSIRQKMDILTQMVLGGAVSSQILKSETPRKAIILGGIIAAIPDLDMFLIFNVSDY